MPPSTPGSAECAAAGGASAEDRRFRDRHRPWDAGGAWAVSAVVALEDGRRVELRQDLATKIDCRASDADRAGRDYTNEILHDGAPDGSRWLGLNRKTFVAASSVRQAQILGLLDDRRRVERLDERVAVDAGGAGQLGKDLGFRRVLVVDVERAVDGFIEWQGRFRLEAAHRDGGTAGRLGVQHETLPVEKAERERLAGRLVHLLPVMSDSGLGLIAHRCVVAGVQAADDQRHRRGRAERLVDGHEHGRKAPAPGTHGVAEIENLLAH